MYLFTKVYTVQESEWLDGVFEGLVRYSVFTAGLQAGSLETYPGSRTPDRPMPCIQTRTTHIRQALQSHRPT